MLGTPSASPCTFSPLIPPSSPPRPLITMVGTPTALVAAAIAVAATARAATAAAVSQDAAKAAEVGLSAAGKIFTLTPDCDSGCQAQVASSLSARGCSNVAMLPTLRLATAECGATPRRAGRGFESGAAEIAALRSLPGVMGVEDDGLVEGEEPIAMDTADAEVPLKGPNGEDYFWGLDRYVQQGPVWGGACSAFQARRDARRARRSKRRCGMSAGGGAVGSPTVCSGNVPTLTLTLMTVIHDLSESIRSGQLPSSILALVLAQHQSGLVAPRSEPKYHRLFSPPGKGRDGLCR